ncbi:hypothetical protein E1A91_A09G041600v1 [Gossypium mustelinum]|uniref:Uncharacterized protein n=1 Tax=Gossypium mustelinum TaxID=34275 RepID=A0A5D2XUH4_GOSMU|nr:hypothetical protein E1A91_A09G041600v1 [Gossypium mustelinum]
MARNKYLSTLISSRNIFKLYSLYSFFKEPQMLWSMPKLLHFPLCFPAPNPMTDEAPPQCEYEGCEVVENEGHGVWVENVGSG